MMKKAIKFVADGVTFIFVGGMMVGFIGSVALLSYAAGDLHLLEHINVNKKTEEQNESEKDSVETEE